MTNARQRPAPFTRPEFEARMERARALMTEAKLDALLITSRYEGGPAVAVEALAQGVPVVMGRNCTIWSAGNRQR